jgi:flagellar basal body rod protein FlgC
MSELDLLGVAATGMAQQRTILELAARNVAAAQASTPQRPYHRLVADFSEDPLAGEDSLFNQEARVRESDEPADALSEMVAMLDAQRAYEADASIFEVGKRLAEQTLEVDRL